MKLHNFFRSGTSHRLRIALNLKGLATDYVAVDLRTGAHEQAAFKALNVEVRCAPGTWEEEQGEADADRWIRISEDGQEEITWKTGS